MYKRQDFICAAEFATTENVNFMATHGKGLICMPMSEAFIQKLQFPQMVQHNTDNHETAFTVSIDHVSTSTGISAAERSITAMACEMCIRDRSFVCMEPWNGWANSVNEEGKHEVLEPDEAMTADWSITIEKV